MEMGEPEENAIPTGRVPCRVEAHAGCINGLEVTRCGKYCVTCGADKLCKLWSIEALPGSAPAVEVSAGAPAPMESGEKCIREFKGHSYSVLGVAVSDDNAILASCGTDKYLYLWDITAARDTPVRKLRDHTDAVNSISFGGTGELNTTPGIVVTGSADATAKIWDMRSNSHLPMHTLKDSNDSVLSVCVLGQVIYTASVDGYLRGYDVRLGKMTSDCFARPITSIRVPSLHQKSLLVQVLDSRLHLLDIATGGALNTFGGHTNTRYSTGSDISQSAEKVLAGSEDGYVHEWDVLTGSTTVRHPGHRGPVRGVRFLPTDTISGVDMATLGGIRFVSVGVDGSLCGHFR